MTRIAIAGFQHETNTFSAVPTRYEDFLIADSWPPLLEGEAVLAGTAGMNLPIAGFAAAAAAQRDLTLIPILWCAAEPAGRVEDAAFDRIAARILAGLKAAGPIDALYLDLHGAMVTESAEDGEGLLLARLRAHLGPAVPIVVSLDLHANITPAMVALADQIAIFRTYPHLDMAATGARCLSLLLALSAGHRPAKAFRQAPYLIPLSAQFTGAAPFEGLYARLSGIAAAGESADIALGFTAADIPDTGPSVVAYAPSATRAAAIADDLMAVILAIEGTVDAGLLSPGDAVARAMAERGGAGPVVLADVQDNPGGGASSDSTGLLAALVDAGAQGAAVAVMADPRMAARAHAAGVGAVIEGPLGGASGAPYQAPFVGRFQVERLGDGCCAFTGAMYGGAIGMLGPSAVLRLIDPVAEVRILVSSNRIQALDRAIFTHLGIDPAACRILALKSTVHYRADFDPIAALTLNVAAPGGMPCDLTALPYRRLRPGVRLGPLGPPHRPQP
ncbi:MAG: M81 family metallopeptidase [Pseudomonadota bacterium]